MGRRVEVQLCSVYVMRIATRFRAPDCSWALWVLLWGVLANPIVTVPVSAKTPGGLHCYRLVCHRVMTLTETHRLVGSTRTMVASYYDDPGFDRYNTGQLTSSGEKFDASDPGKAASTVFPDGTELLLWNASNGRAAHVRVNDFGPFLGNRTLDITKSLAERLDITRKGVVALRVTVIASPSTNQSRYRRFRVYPKVAGYLGVYGELGLITLANDLISDSRSADAPGIICCARRKHSPPTTETLAAWSALDTEWSADTAILANSYRGPANLATSASDGKRDLAIATASACE